MKNLNLKNVLIGCGIAVAGVVLGAKSKKAQTAVSTVEAGAVGAWNTLKDKFSKKKSDEGAPVEEESNQVPSEEFPEVN